MKCTKCGGELPEGSKFCFFCGAAQTAPEKIRCAKCGGELPGGSKFCYFCGVAQSPSPTARRKNRTTYQLLAFFLGGLGVHSFYAGYTGKGIVQLLLCCTGVSSIWALIDIFTVTKDAGGVPMDTAAPAPPEPRKDAATARPEVEKITEVPVRPEVPAQDPGEKPPKSRFVYQVLAVFLGSLGIHNFYAGRTGIAITQLLISCTGASSIWALIEILAIKKDGSGRPMTVGGQNPKSRNKYRWLAFFLGAFGIHDFYAGRIVPGFIHLVISCTGIGFVVSAVWAFVEIFAVKKDSEGVVMPLKKDKLFTILSLVFLVIGLGIWGYKEIMNLRFFWGVSALLFYPYALALLFGFLALIGGRLVPFLAALLIPVATIGTSILLDNNPERQAAFRADMFKRRVARDIARGIEFDARAETLVRCPANFSGEYTVPYEVKRIEKGAFEGCTQLTAVTISHNVYTVGENAFKGCTGLKEVKIEKHVIKRHAYHNWTSTHSEYKPESRSLYGGHSDDSEWYNDRDVSVQEIGAHAFEGCTKLTGVVYVPRGVYLGENAFKGCPCKIERW